MPYILQTHRDRMDSEGLEHEHWTTSGDLNYQITKQCLAYLDTHGTNYQTINDIIGALEGCKLEFYRRIASGYEDQKIKENGDVYPQVNTTKNPRDNVASSGISLNP